MRRREITGSGGVHLPKRLNYQDLCVHPLVRASSSSASLDRSTVSGDPLIPRQWKISVKRVVSVTLGKLLRRERQ